ncbi:MAG: hypothetical protein D6784_03345 [Chloroflexi bacterium]|nr:MAG: hypothetical protein D6784_03345 [Chloroflexota bacterium]
MTSDTFDILLLIARPAAGKSEIIDYLKRTDVPTRRQRFHIGEFEEIDDFPMLWAWFEEDAILSELGHPRLHTDEDGYFKAVYLWDVLIRRICLEYAKRRRDNPDYHQQMTTIIEFARGKEHGGFARAFQHLSREVVQRAAILYINVSYEESVRKNRRRFNPNRPDSILEHALPDEKMERLYKEIDWEEVSAADPEFINIQGHRVPYVVFENEDDVTTGRGEALGNRLEEALGRLWALYRRGRSA